MPSIVPFRPFRYNPERISDPGAVIAPPYDVIGPEKRAELLARDPHNVIRLILPTGPEESRYAEAGTLFRQWIDDRTLIREQDDALYVYRQRFTHPTSGDSVERLGFIARVALSPFSEGEILPHERTLSGPKEDRLRLMHATAANLESIFGIYRDDDGVSRQRLDEATGSAPLISAVDADGVTHTIWRLTDASEVAATIEDLRCNAVYIVDGHHRYETALAYRNARAEAEEPTSNGPHPYDAIMMFLAPMSDPGLIILPTHRTIHSLGDFDFDALLARIASSFDILEIADRDAAIEALTARSDTPSYLLTTDDRTVLATLRDAGAIDGLIDPALPSALRGLDVTILHEYMLERELGISKEAQEAGRNIGYVKGASEAFAAAHDPNVQMVVLMNPTKLEQVTEVAGTGSVMPQKSTFFYPKLASGLLFNPLW